MDELEGIDRLLTKSTEKEILQEMGIDNRNHLFHIHLFCNTQLCLVSNYLMMDDRQEEAKWLAANATPKVYILSIYVYLLIIMLL